VGLWDRVFTIDEETDYYQVNKWDNNQ